MELPPTKPLDTESLDRDRETTGLRSPGIAGTKELLPTRTLDTKSGDRDRETIGLRSPNIAGTMEQHPTRSQSGSPVVPSGSFFAMIANVSAFARAEVESLKDDTPNSSLIVGGVFGGLAVLLAAFLIIHFMKRPSPQEQSQQEESSKRPLPGPLLDEIEFDTPLALASTAMNRGIELEADDLMSDSG
jgi:hypothetical protein